MSAQMESKRRRGRKSYIDTVRRSSNRDADALLKPDLVLLKQIAAAADGWHKAALDPFKLAHLKEAALVKVDGTRVRVTHAGREAIARAEP